MASSVENSSNSMGEAMLLGVPVVASRNGGIPSMITEEEEGALVARNTNFECVQLMTMHASKGLQFPVVISVLLICIILLFNL